MFKGSMVALVTPMKGGHVDVESLCRLVDFHIEQGTQVLVAAGTTGEAATLTDKEKALVIKTVVDQACERIGVIAGTAAQSTAHTMELSLMAMELGADAALIMTPAYIKPTQHGLIEHYTRVAHEVALPIILYNVPSRTACDLLPETVIELSHVSNIVGIKDATGDLARHLQLMQACAGRLDIFSGDDFSAYKLMLNGAKGNISVTANVAPKLMAQLCHLAMAGNKEDCETLQAQLLPLHRQLFVEASPIAAKWAVHCMGLISEEIRLPLTPLSDAARTPLLDTMRQLNIRIKDDL